MENLKNPPLKSVQFNVWWHLYSQEDFDKANMIIGPFYKNVLENYPRMGTSSFNSGSNKGMVPFGLMNFQELMPQENEFPKIRINRRRFEYVTTKDVYDWEDYKKECLEKSQILIEELETLIKPDHYHLELVYENQFSDILDNKEVIDFITSKLNTNIDGPIVDNAELENFDFNIKRKYDFGSLVVHLGLEEKKFNLNFFVESEKINPNKEDFAIWIDKAHTEIETLFLKITKGKLYESFQIPT